MSVLSGELTDLIFQIHIFPLQLFYRLLHFNHLPVLLSNGLLIHLGSLDNFNKCLLNPFLKSHDNLNIMLFPLTSQEHSHNHFKKFRNMLLRVMFSYLHHINIRQFLGRYHSFIIKNMYLRKDLLEIAHFDNPFGTFMINFLQVDVNRFTICQHYSER